MTKPQRKWEKQKPKAQVGEHAKPPRIPMNVLRHPVKLPKLAPLTDRERQAA